MFQHSFYIIKYKTPILLDKKGEAGQPGTQVKSDWKIDFFHFIHCCHPTICQSNPLSSLPKRMSLWPCCDQRRSSAANRSWRPIRRKVDTPARDLTDSSDADELAQIPARLVHSFRYPFTTEASIDA